MTVANFSPLFIKEFCVKSVLLSHSSVTKIYKRICVEICQEV